MATTQSAESSAWRVTAHLGLLSSAPALIALSFALTLLAPLWLLLLAPLLFGVPHVIGDLRCLKMCIRDSMAPALFVGVRAIDSLGADPRSTQRELHSHWL